MCVCVELGGGGWWEVLEEKGDGKGGVRRREGCVGLWGMKVKRETEPNTEAGEDGWFFVLLYISLQL